MRPPPNPELEVGSCSLASWLRRADCCASNQTLLYTGHSVFKTAAYTTQGLFYTRRLISNGPPWITSRSIHRSNERAHSSITRYINCTYPLQLALSQPSSHAMRAILLSALLAACLAPGVRAEGGSAQACHNTTSKTECLTKQACVFCQASLVPSGCFLDNEAKLLPGCECAI